MSPTISKESDLGAPVEPIIDALLGFLWRQWAQIGLSGEIAFRDNWVLDPEALLLFTLRIGRFDPRLFDEVLDWCARNDDWLSIQRLKTMTGESPATFVREAGSACGPQDACEDMQSRTIEAVAALLAAQRHRWRTLMPASTPSREPLPFFLDTHGDPLPHFGKSDLHFQWAGLLRSPVLLRGLSQPPARNAPTNLVFTLRALFGVDPRAEAVVYLLTHPVAGAREIARATGYAPGTMHVLLARLAQGQFLIGSGKSGYGIDQERWRVFLGDAAFRPRLLWVDWRRALPALATAIESFLKLATAQNRSSYLRASDLLRLDTLLREALTGSGLSNPFGVPCRLDDVNEQFPERLLRLAALLNRGDTSYSASP